MNQLTQIRTSPILEQALAGYRFRSGALTQPLTHTEREVLRVLAHAAGKAVHREEILREIWGVETDVESASVDNVVARLRCKLQVVGESPHLIQTVRGWGYRWSDRVELRDVAGSSPESRAGVTAVK